MRPSLVLAACLLFEDPPLGVPVGKRQAQTLQVGIARENLRFDRSDLSFATFHLVARHSRRRSRALQRNLVERTAAVEHGPLAREVLPTGHGHIDVGWLQFNGKGDSRFFFAGDDRRCPNRRRARTRPVPGLELFTIGRRMHSTGFCVLCTVSAS